MSFARLTAVLSVRNIRRLTATLLCVPAIALAQQPTPPDVAARAWLLFDASTMQVLASANPDAQVEPASLTKMMTAYVVGNALKSRTISLDQMVTPSEKAWRAPGSPLSSGSLASRAV